MQKPPLFAMDRTPSNFEMFEKHNMPKIRPIFADEKIILSDSAAITTISNDGHWLIADGSRKYDVLALMATIDVYDVSA